MKIRMLWLGVVGIAALAQAPHFAADEMTMPTRPFYPVPTFSAQAGVVEIPVVVRDGDGNSIAGLSADDFEVSENGKPLHVTSFAVEHHDAVSGRTAAGLLPNGLPSVGFALKPGGKAPPARSVAFYFDDLNSGYAELGRARTAAQKYLGDGFANGERVGVYTSSSVGAIDFSSDPAKVVAAMAQIAPHPRASADHACPLITPGQALEIVNEHDPDALQLALTQALGDGCLCSGEDKSKCEVAVRARASQIWGMNEAQYANTLDIIHKLVEILALRRGDRVLVIASSGFIATTLQKQLAQVEDLAQRSHVVINTLDAKGVNIRLGGDAGDIYGEDPSTGGGALDTYRDRMEFGESMDQNTPLSDMAAATGGRFIEHANDMKRNFDQLVTPATDAYTLTITPENMKSDGAFHSLNVKLVKPGNYKIQFRPGYDAPDAKTAAPAAAMAAQQAMDAAVLGSDERDGLPMVSRAGATKTADGKPGVKVLFTVDPRPIGFRKENGRHVANLTFIAALLDGDGNFVTAGAGDMALHLKDDSLAQILKPGVGISAAMVVNAAPGTYRVREVVAGEGAGLIGAVTQTVIIP